MTSGTELRITVQEHISVVLFYIRKIIVIILLQQTGLRQDEKMILWRDVLQTLSLKTQLPFRFPGVSLVALKTTRTLWWTSIVEAICKWKHSHTLSVNHTGIQIHTPGQKVWQSEVIKTILHVTAVNNKQQFRNSKSTKWNFVILGDNYFILDK